MRSLAAAAALIVSLAACGGLRSTAAENAGLGAITAITMDKSPCYGSCPAYSVRFSDDGRAAYVGGRFAALQGTFSGVADFPSLAAWVASQHPETLSDRYPVNTDAPAVRLTIDRGSRRQTIEAATGIGPNVPLRLAGILLALDGEMTRIHWRREDAMTRFLGTFAGPSASYSGPMSAVDIEQATNGVFFAYGRLLRCDNARPSLSRRGGALRIRCSERSSVLRVTADGFQAEGDALPAGSYRRIDPHGASVLWGTQPEPRVAE
jgi:hypothetical protein